MGTFEQWSKALLCAASALHHERLDPTVEKSVRDQIQDSFAHLDELHVTHRFQNACLYVAERYDHRLYNLSHLLTLATLQANNVIYKSEV